MRTSNLEPFEFQISTIQEFNFLFFCREESACTDQIAGESRSITMPVTILRDIERPLLNKLAARVHMLETVTYAVLSGILTCSCHLTPLHLTKQTCHSSKDILVDRASWFPLHTFTPQTGQLLSCFSVSLLHIPDHWQKERLCQGRRRKAQ